MQARDNDGLVAEINNYMVERNKLNDDYKYFWCSLFGGYTKSQKISAAKALIAYIKDDKNLTDLIPHLGALEQGGLETFWKNFLDLNPQKHASLTQYLGNLSVDSSPRYGSLDGYDSDTPSRIQGRCSKD